MQRHPDLARGNLKNSVSFNQRLIVTSSLSNAYLMMASIRNVLPPYYTVFSLLTQLITERTRISRARCGIISSVGDGATKVHPLQVKTGLEGFRRSSNHRPFGCSASFFRRVPRHMAGSHQRLRHILLLFISDDAVVQHRRHVLVAALIHDAFSVKSRVAKSLDHRFPCRMVSDYRCQ